MLVLLETNSFCFVPVSDSLCRQFSIIFSAQSMFLVSEILVPGALALLLLATDIAE